MTLVLCCQNKTKKSKITMKIRFCNVFLHVVHLYIEEMRRYTLALTVNVDKISTKSTS